MNVFVKVTKRLAILVIALGGCISTGLACGCPGTSDATLADDLKWAVKNADAVFLGEVGRFDYLAGVPNQFLEKERETIPGLTWETKTAVFKVDRWWKGDLEEETLLVTDATRNSDGTRSGSSCDYGFEDGKTYLVFARKYDGYLKTSACSLTRQQNEDQVKDILPLLGESKKPVKPSS